ncbi:MAG TPA: ATP-binding cassette domain-containing protein [Candidatus Dormibacteraeota bacterium]|nr:ATP-binding cassette domain-containing protein [Candidatus Dormibacteraeota bacterium]
MAAAAIRTSGLTKDFGGGHGLFDLELQVSTREAFGLLGPEGAGKTVAIRLLMGMLRPTRGSAYVFGLDCFRDAAEVKRRVGYVPDEVPEFGAMRGGEIVAYLAGLRGGVHKDRVSELAERFDLDLGPRHPEYSRDARQKLSIVLAFMHDPDLLVLDEPYEDLDERGAATLHSLIDEARERGATILLGSRAAAEVERHCDVVGLLRRGKLSRMMRVEDLPEELGERSRKALPP